MNPWKSDWNVILEAPHVQQILPKQGLCRQQRALREGNAPYRGWSLLTAHGTRPTRLAQMNVCKVIRNLFTFQVSFGQLYFICCMKTTLCVLTCFLICFFLDLLQVELKMRKTCFWRHQKGKPDSYLATIEAIYYFLRDYHKYYLCQEYDGEYDNLLFFYSFLHSVVNKAKTERKTWAQIEKLLSMIWSQTGTRQAHIQLSEVIWWSISINCQVVVMLFVPSDFENWKKGGQMALLWLMICQGCVTASPTVTTGIGSSTNSDKWMDPENTDSLFSHIFIMY